MSERRRKDALTQLEERFSEEVPWASPEWLARGAIVAHFTGRQSLDERFPNAVKTALDGVSDRDSGIVRDACMGMTYRAIGEKCGLTAERVRQLADKVIRKVVMYRWSDLEREKMRAFAERDAFGGISLEYKIVRVSSQEGSGR